MIKFYISTFKSILVLGVLAFLGQKVNAQYNTTSWKFSNPKQFGITIMDMDFADNNNVIAVGSDGGIAKSTDGGANWTYGIFNFVLGPAATNPGTATKSTFADVHYVTPTVAYAVGTNGCMAKTIDGGATWSLVTTPLYAKARNINAVWFINKDTGYIGGQHNTPDSLPKLYFTRNGGATWDSLNAPLGGKTRVGYINNPNLQPQDWTIDAKDKEIMRIEFTSPTNGYIIGSGSGLFPRFPSANSSTCLPTGTTTSTGSNNAALIWKFSNGQLFDYSLSKERLGYTGINTATITCTTTYGNITPQTQTYKALHVINDSSILVMSFNNNIVVRIYTGRNDSTLNANIPGLYERGRYQILNFPFPPNGGTPIPANQVLLASNPLVIKKAPNGKLFVNSGSGTIAPSHRLYTSMDTGRTWTPERAIPSGRNYSEFSIWSLDINPSGKFLAAGQAGIVTDSVPGTAWKSDYITVPAAASYNKIDFVDCANGIATGGSFITVTEDGGNTWVDKQRPDFANSYYSINGLAYPKPNIAYFAVSNGVVYKSPDKGTTLDPVYSNFNFQIQDVAAIGNDSVWAVASSQFSIPAASRTSAIFRSTDGGNTWTQHGNFAVGTTFQTLTDIEFPTRLVGYAAGNKDTLWKTTNGGTTWTKLPLPTPGVTPQITYTDLFALDENTVFVTGNGFPRKVVFRSTDGGNTWTDITANIPTIYPVGNMNGVLFQDVNNGYVVGPGGALLITNNGGNSWRLDLAPTASLFSAMSFSPKTVPAPTPMANRKMFVVGPNIQGAPIMLYGNPLNQTPSSTEIVTQPSCTNPSGGTITVTATGGTAPYTYSINGGAYQSSNVFTGLQSGSHILRIKGSGCDSTQKLVNIAFNDNMSIRASNDTAVCAGAPVPLNVTGQATSYSWSPAAGLSQANIANPIATVNTSTAYVVTASLNGCSRKDTVQINILPNPVINAGPDQSILVGDQTQLSGSGSGNITSIAWTPAASIVSGSGTLNPVVKPSPTTTYTLTIKNSLGCTSTDDVVVTVIPMCIDIKNAFSPNGDGINDKWIVTNGSACTSQVMVSVFNRYGNLVYKNDHYQNNWDGTYNGKPVPDGTYYYVVNIKLINNKPMQFKGDLTVIR